MVFIISTTRKPSYFKVVHVMFLFFLSLHSAFVPTIHLTMQDL